MFGKSGKRNRVLTVLAVFCLTMLNCVTAKADEPLTYVQGRMLEGYIHRNEVISKYGGIWIGYTTVSNEKITTSSGDERFIIKKAYYCYRKNGDYVVLGWIDETGLYDKNGTCLRDFSAIPVASDLFIAGISSLLIEDILDPIPILQSKTVSGMWMEPDPIVAVGIDTQQDTLVRRPPMF